MSNKVYFWKDVECAQCGKKFTPYPSSIYKDRHGRYCSYTCYQKRKHVAKPKKRFFVIYATLRASYINDTMREIMSELKELHIPVKSCSYRAGQIDTEHLTIIFRSCNTNFKGFRPDACFGALTDLEREELTGHTNVKFEGTLKEYILEKESKGEKICQ